jgi:class 3 adenylate cyclase
MSADAVKPASATFVFADIAGFTALTEAHGDDEAAAVVADFCAAVRADLPASGGTQVKTIGDALMLRIPDPGAAIVLGLRITHELMLGHGAPAVRVGLHHGPAVERDGDYFGAAVNLAARVSAEASGGEVLLTGQTAALAPGLAGVVPFLERRRIAACWLGGTPPRNTSVSVPRLTPDRSVRTTASPGPGSGSATGRISPRPGARSQNACASSSTSYGSASYGISLGRPGSRTRVGGDRFGWRGA